MSELRVVAALAAASAVIAAGVVVVVGLDRLPDEVAWPAFLPTRRTTSQLVEATVVTVGLVAMAAVLAAIAGVRPAAAAALRRVRPAALLACALSGLALNVLLVAGVAVLAEQGWIAPPGGSATAELTLGETNLATWCVVASIALVVAPLGEELLVRGFGWSLLERSVPTWVVIGVTAGVFALLHGHSVHRLAALLAGLLFGLVRWRTGSVLASTAAHAGANLFPVLVVAGSITQLHLEWLVASLALLVGCGAWLFGSPTVLSGEPPSATRPPTGGRCRPAAPPPAPPAPPQRNLRRLVADAP